MGADSRSRNWRRGDRWSTPVDQSAAAVRPIPAPRTVADGPWGRSGSIHRPGRHGPSAADFALCGAIKSGKWRFPDWPCRHEPAITARSACSSPDHTSVTLAACGSTVPLACAASASEWLASFAQRRLTMCAPTPVHRSSTPRRALKTYRRGCLSERWFGP